MVKRTGPASRSREGEDDGVVRLTFGAIQARMPDKEDKMRAQLKWVVGLNTFEICVTNADGTHLVHVTDNTVIEITDAGRGAPSSEPRDMTASQARERCANHILLSNIA